MPAYKRPAWVWILIIGVPVLFTLAAYTGRGEVVGVASIVLFFIVAGEVEQRIERLIQLVNDLDTGKIKPSHTPSHLLHPLQ